MFRDGIYKVSYASPLHDEGSGEHALAAVRGGQITGSDPLGAVFVGDIGCLSNSVETINVQLTVPAGGELVTGFRAGGNGAVLNVQARIDPENPSEVQILDVGGDPVAVQLEYLGPLPD